MMIMMMIMTYMYCTFSVMQRIDVPCFRLDDILCELSLLVLCSAPEISLRGLRFSPHIKNQLFISCILHKKVTFL